MKLKYYFKISWLKTICFNFRVLPFKTAVKLPIVLFRHTRIASLKGKIEIASPAHHAMIKIGRCDVLGMENSPSVLAIDGVCRFAGKASIASGSVLQVKKGGELDFGKKFRITGRTAIYCHKKISFGDEVLISWDNLFMDSDHHDILDDKGEKINTDREISIGNHVWFGCRCTILKGFSVADGCVIASGSVLNKKFTENGCVIGGAEQRILRANISWKE